MSVTTIYGKPGSNKSHFSIFYALLITNKFKKKYLVCNFPLHPEHLLKYCLAMGQYWNVNNLIIRYIDLESGGMDYILSSDDSVIIFDESALYTTARGSGSVSTKTSKFLKELTQVRHRKNILLSVSQNPQQIDSSIKNLCQEVVYCEGISTYCPELKTQKLQYRSVRTFLPENFEIWYGNPRLRKNPIKSKMLCKKFFGGFLKISDAQIFNIYSSFALVHESGQNINFSDSKIQYDGNMQQDGFIIYQYSLAKVFKIDRKNIYIPKLKQWAFKNLWSDFYQILLLIENKYHISIYDIVQELFDRKLILILFILTLYFCIIIIIKFPPILILLFFAFKYLTNKKVKKVSVKKYPMIWETRHD